MILGQLEVLHMFTQVFKFVVLAFFLSKVPRDKATCCSAWASVQNMASPKSISRRLSFHKTPFDGTDISEWSYHKRCDQHPACRCAFVGTSDSWLTTGQHTAHSFKIEGRLLPHFVTCKRRECFFGDKLSPSLVLDH